MKTKKNIIAGWSGLLFGLGLLGLSANAFAGALHVVRIENHASQSIYQVYASPPGEPWGDDRLGTNVIVSGNSISLDLDDGSGRCRSDIKVVFKNGVERTRSNVDICDIRSWIHNNSRDWFTFASF